MEYAVKYGTWNVSQFDKHAKDALTRAGYSPLTARVLCSRGYDTPEKARQFLSASEQLPDPLQDPKPGFADGSHLLQFLFAVSFGDVPRLT